MLLFEGMNDIASVLSTSMYLTIPKDKKIKEGDPWQPSQETKGITKEVVEAGKVAVVLLQEANGIAKAVWSIHILISLSTISK